VRGFAQGMPEDAVIKTRQALIALNNARHAHVTVTLGHVYCDLYLRQR
jgi:hypothetical protein